MSVEDFVASSLPPPPCRVLEVGCGQGDLARALAGRGYEVTAIDPEAPEGPLFEKVTLEDFAAPEPFDAVVASTSLHHIHDLGAAAAKLRALLRPAGLLILNEFSWNRMDGRTAAWYASHAGPGAFGEGLSGEELLAAWKAHASQEDLHTIEAMRAAIDESFAEISFEWTPFLAEGELGRPDLVEEERALIDGGEITPIGFRYVGTPR